MADDEGGGDGRGPQELPPLIVDFSEHRRRNGAGRTQALPLTYFWELGAQSKSRGWLIKGVLARGEISSLIGPPGAAKSASAIDAVVHGATGWDWRGYKVPAPFGSVYFALERGGLVGRRLIGYQQRDSLPETLPIAICDRQINLFDGSCVSIMLDTIEEAEQHMQHDVGLIVIDTANKGLALGNGDENKASDQNKVNAFLRRLQERKHIHITTIGHTGKDSGRGERGSNAKLADVDVLISLSGDTLRTATIDKANDRPLGPLTAFELEVIEIGRDEDGEPITTAIVARHQLTPQIVERPGRKRKAATFGEIMRGGILDAYGRLSDEIGWKTHGLDLKPVVKVKLDDIRKDLIDRGILEVDGNRISATSRSHFHQAKAALIRERKLIEKDGWIWVP
jgi:hypothetical protein